MLFFLPSDVKEKKEYVVVSSRVHPGESNSSWMLKGLVDHITSDQPDAMVSFPKLRIICSFLVIWAAVCVKEG